jgi:hypothetical protein
LAPAAALPALLFKPPLPWPVVDPAFAPGLEELEVDPLVPAAPPEVPPAPAPAPPAPPAPPPPACAKAAAPEIINTVAKPIAVSFMCCSHFC